MMAWYPQCELCWAVIHKRGAYFAETNTWRCLRCINADREWPSDRKLLGER